MGDEGLSQTALMAAAARAAHLVVDDEPYILRDELAAPLLGEMAEVMLGYHRTQGDHIVLAGTRAMVTARGRYIERLARRWPEQYVILGAGLDTFPYREGNGGRVFEVDRPAMQRWKRDRLAAAGIAVPAGLTYVAADFEDGSPFGRLAAAGFDSRRPALVSWLGVSMYLTREAIAATLAEVRRLAPGSRLVLEYMLPPGLRDEAGEEMAAVVAEAVAERGEPWRTFLTPEELAGMLAAHGLEVVEDLSLQEATGAELWRLRTDVLRPIRFSRLARVAVPATRAED